VGWEKLHTYGTLYNFTFFPVHSSDIYSLASYYKGSGSILEQSRWDKCYKKWHWEQFFSGYYSYSRL